MTPGRRLIVVGGGYIGLEVAAVATGLGLDVVVLEAGDRVLGRVVAPALSDFYTSRHRAAGVDIRCNASVQRICGDTAVEAIETAAGERFDADLVIVGIGILPNSELALEAGLDAANGIRVDAHGQTAVAGIAAAGDCTRQTHPLIDGEIRLESVHNAIGQAKAVSATLCGQPTPFEELPWFWSDQYDMKLQIAGVSRDYDQTVFRGDPESNSFSLFYLRRGVAVAVDCINNPRVFMMARKLLPLGRDVPADVLADPDSDLGEFCN